MTKEQKQERAEKERSLMSKFFAEWVLSFDEKAFDLTKPNEEVAEEFYQRFIKNFYKDATIKDFARAVVKSFYEAGKAEEIDEFVSFEDLRIKKPYKIIEKFLNDYVAKGATCNTADSCYDAIAKILFERTQEIYGEDIYLEILNPKYKTFGSLKNQLIALGEQKGYEPSTADARFLLKKEKGQPVVAREEYQKVLLENYKLIAEKFVGNYIEYVNTFATKQQFNTFWGDIETVLASIESRLSETVKKSAEFKKAKAIVTHFYEKKKESVRRNGTKEGMRGDYYAFVEESMKRHFAGKSTQEDKKIINNFFDKLAKLNNAMRILDSHGKNYPANYFCCMPIHPANLIHLLIRVEKHEKCFTEEQIKAATLAKRTVRASFFTEELINTGDMHEVERVLKTLKGRGEVAKVVGNMSKPYTDEQFSELVEKVETYITRYDLPKNELCIATIGRELSRGREPINMREEEKCK